MGQVFGRTVSLRGAVPFPNTPASLGPPSLFPHPEEGGPTRFGSMRRSPVPRDNANLLPERYHRRLGSSFLNLRRARVFVERDCAPLQTDVRFARTSGREGPKAGHNRASTKTMAPSGAVSQVVTEAAWCSM